jgi:hypothetical protein
MSPPSYVLESLSGQHRITILKKLDDVLEEFCVVE